MDIFGYEWSLDLSWVLALGTKPMHEIMWHFFVNGGWFLFLVALLYGAWINFVFYKQSKWGSKVNYIFLAIDIPRDNFQTPKAVENIFSALAGAHTPLDWHEKNLKGQSQLGFSLEIVSIDGFVQFLIRTPVHFRDLVEASVYSQYPEAEITEVEDYTADINVKFPNNEYNLWGTDLVLSNKDYYPIKTYSEFQEELDNEFKDPMAAVLEIMSKIGQGEQIWMQIMIFPADIGWQKEGMKEVTKMLGLEDKAKKNFLDKTLDAPLKGLSFVGDQVFGTTAGPEEEKKEEQRNMMFLPPHEKREVEAVLQKIDKVCFNCKARFIYFGKKEVFKKPLGVSGMMGAIKQFNTSQLNGFKPGKNKTQAKLFLKDLRMSILQNKILAAYKDRNPDTCSGKYLLNVEELATLYHFPYIEVKAQMVKKVEAKKAHAPIGLPLEDELPTEAMEEEPQQEQGKQKPVIDYDNDYFENRFAKDKTGETDENRKKKVIDKLKEQGKLPQEEDDRINQPE